MQKKKPPKKNPISLYNGYTLNGKIKVEYEYRDDSYTPDNPLIYTKEQIDSCIEEVKRKKTFCYGITDSWLYQALEKYNIQAKKVAVMGSDEIRYESICLAYGGKPTIIEYNRIIVQDTRVKALTVEEYNRNSERYDVAFSISSFEHDELGRYGDTLNPAGDLEAMKKMKYILKPNGIFFLAVPVGADAVVWNVHRRYGRIRLPLLLATWEVVDSFGYNDYMLDKDYGTGAGPQPVFVLKNK